MKTFKINKLEMFAITKPTVFKIISTTFFLSLAFLVVITSSLTTIDSDAITLFVTLILVAIMLLFFPKLVVNSKIVLSVQPQEELQNGEALRRTDYLLSIINPTFEKEVQQLCANRIAYLINLGYFQQAKEENDLFLQHFGTETSPLISAAFFYNKSILNLYEENFDEYQMNIKKAYEFKDSAKGLAKINLINMIDNHSYFVNSFFTDDPNFETVVLNDMKLAERVGKSAVFSRYFAIFNYYKRHENKERAIQYANTLIQVANGNFELYDCRVAKEYIENGNSSN